MVVGDCSCWVGAAGFLVLEGEAELSLGMGVRNGADSDLEVAKLGPVELSDVNNNCAWPFRTCSGIGSPKLKIFFLWGT